MGTNRASWASGTGRADVVVGKYPHVAVRIAGVHVAAPVTAHVSDADILHVDGVQVLGGNSRGRRAGSVFRKPYAATHAGRTLCAVLAGRALHAGRAPITFGTRDTSRTLGARITWAALRPCRSYRAIQSVPAGRPREAGQTTSTRGTSRSSGAYGTLRTRIAFGRGRARNTLITFRANGANGANRARIAFITLAALRTRRTRRASQPRRTPVTFSARRPGLPLRSGRTPGTSGPNGACGTRGTGNPRSSHWALWSCRADGARRANRSLRAGVSL